MLKIALIVAGILALIVVVVVAVGYSLPEAHVASREATLPRPPDRVFTTLADVEKYPLWRSDVQKVEVLAQQGDTLRWREHGGNGVITFEIAEKRPVTRLVSRIADTSLAFGGTWTYELAQEAAGTRLKITEHGRVFNPVFRFMSRFVFGHTATMEKFLVDLDRHLQSSSQRD